MKVALLGDIHGNAEALRAVLSAAKESGAGELLITGDLVGYYFEPARVLELLSDWPWVAVRGNHEDFLAQARSDEELLEPLEARYGAGIRIALSELSEAQKTLLCTLSHPKRLQFGTLSVLLCHGAPWDNDAYLYPDAPEDAFGRCADYDADIVVLGHTHYPMVRRSGSTLIVNPGSVGQPRNRSPGAHWCLLDTVSGEVQARRESYNVEALARDAMLRHPELPYLSQVLTRE